MPFSKTVTRSSTGVPVRKEVQIGEAAKRYLKLLVNPFVEHHNAASLAPPSRPSVPLTCRAYGVLTTANTTGGAQWLVANPLAAPVGSAAAGYEPIKHGLDTANNVGQVDTGAGGAGIDWDSFSFNFAAASSISDFDAADPSKKVFRPIVAGLRLRQIGRTDALSGRICVGVVDNHASCTTGYGYGDARGQPGNYNGNLGRNWTTVVWTPMDVVAASGVTTDSGPRHETLYRDEPMSIYNMFAFIEGCDSQCSIEFEYFCHYEEMGGSVPYGAHSFSRGAQNSLGGAPSGWHTNAFQARARAQAQEIFRISKSDPGLQETMGEIAHQTEAVQGTAHRQSVLEASVNEAVQDDTTVLSYVEPAARVGYSAAAGFFAGGPKAAFAGGMGQAALELKRAYSGKAPPKKRQKTGGARKGAIGKRRRIASHYEL